MPQALTAFDVIVLLVIGASFLYALLKGLTTMLLTIAAWIGAILVTLYGMSPVSDFARGFIEPATLADFVALPVLFLLSLIIFKLLADFIGRQVRTSPVGLLDRSAGAALGLLLGAVLVSSGYLFFSSVLDESRHPDWVREAQLKGLVAYGAEMVAKTGPDIVARLEEDDEAGVLMDRMRESYGRGRDQLRTTTEAAYDDAQRRLLRQKLEDLMAGETPAENSQQEDGPDGQDGTLR